MLTVLLLPLATSIATWTSLDQCLLCVCLCERGKSEGEEREEREEVREGMRIDGPKSMLLCMIER